MHILVTLTGGGMMSKKNKNGCQIICLKGYAQLRFRPTKSLEQVLSYPGSDSEYPKTEKRYQAERAFSKDINTPLPSRLR